MDSNFYIERQRSKQKCWLFDWIVQRACFRRFVKFSLVAAAALFECIYNSLKWKGRTDYLTEMACGCWLSFHNSMLVGKKPHPQIKSFLSSTIKMHGPCSVFVPVLHNFTFHSIIPNYKFWQFKLLYNDFCAWDLKFFMCCFKYKYQTRQSKFGKTVTELDHFKIICKLNKLKVFEDALAEDLKYDWPTD